MLYKCLIPEQSPMTGFFRNRIMRQHSVITLNFRTVLHWKESLQLNIQAIQRGAFSEPLMLPLLKRWVKLPKYEVTAIECSTSKYIFFYQLSTFLSL